MPYLLLAVFIVGYLLITAEQFLRISKSATALFTGVGLWAAYILLTPGRQGIESRLVEHIGSFSGILFFLMAAMTIVELIDLHDGFTIVTERITANGKRLLLCILAFITFYLSAVLDNLTTTIVMASAMRRSARRRGLLSQPSRDLSASPSRASSASPTRASMGSSMASRMDDAT